MAPLRLLIVDDENALLRMLAHAIDVRMPDWAVDTCAVPEAALQLVAANDYDVIVTDVQMPGTDGLALLECIRRDRPGTPTLLMTGHGQHETAVRALRGGAFDYIEKPIDFEYLIASVERGARIREMARRLDEQQAALERHAAELTQTVEQKTRELREANRVKDEFLATLSHELRTPLTAILGWARLLVREELDAALERQALEAIERNATHQARLVEDLLDVSRIITGKLRLATRAVDVCALVEAEVTEAATAARARNVRIESRSASDVGNVSGDPDRLQQIVANLLSNAVKFTPEGGRVQVRTERSAESVVITVSDSGMGIDPQFLPDVFERFRQADRSLGRARGGLGLGLAIVRHLVELHGGTVRAESEGRGRGATFIVTLPASAATERAGRHRERPTHADRDVAGLRVLLVEDDEDTQSFVRVSLERQGATVTAACSAADAMARLDGAPFDVILCDIGLPEEDGCAFIARVRSQAAHARIPAVALTAYARVDDVRTALEAGFDAHVAKPFEPTYLAALVSRLVASAGDPPSSRPPKRAMLARRASRRRTPRLV